MSDNEGTGTKENAKPQTGEWADRNVNPQEDAARYREQTAEKHREFRKDMGLPAERPPKGPGW